MKTIALILLSFGAATLAEARDPQDNPAELKEQIDKAIDKGVEWLKGRQKPEGHFGESSGPTYAPGQAYHNKPGITAFSLLALLKSDVPHNDPVIAKGLAFLQEKLTGEPGGGAG